jgi:hypothetical protein
MLVKLTRWERNRQGAGMLSLQYHRTSVWIAPEKIISMTVQISDVLTDTSVTTIPVKDRPRETYTFVELVGSGHQETNGYGVCETPEEILSIIHHSIQDWQRAMFNQELNS